jgi:septum formation protein
MELHKAELTLASASPRRRELLAAMGVEFNVHSADIDESRNEGEAPEDFVIRLAREKAKQAVLDIELDEKNAVLAADTIVVLGDSVFGKPSDLDPAKRIWAALSGNKHQVMTAVCLLRDDKPQLKLSITDVEFGRITEEQMLRYWATGEPVDKAGAYAIQGFASAWVKQISGSYSNVVGLPLREVNQLLTEIDLNWL